MRKLNMRLYIIGIILFFSSIVLFNIVQGNSSFTNIFSGVVVSIGLFNTSGIFFYKSLEVNDEYLKYVFSFLHIVILTFTSFILFTKMM